MEPTRRQAAVMTALLLAALAGLAGALVAGRPAPGSICPPGATLPILPLRVDYPAYRLEAYGRSAVEVAPGGGLCLGFSWRVAPGVAPPADTILVELVSEAGQTVGRTRQALAADPAAWQPGARVTTQVPLHVARTALPGRARIVVRLLAPDGSPVASLDGREALTVGTVNISPSAARWAARGPALGGLDIRGGLEPWPFWPRPQRVEEEF